MNPFEWLAWIYGKFFANHHPVWGYVTVCIFASAVAALCWARGIEKYNEDQSTRITGSVPTELRLQFFGGPKPPTEIRKKNIYSWYTLWGPSATLSLADANRNPLHQEIIVPENWNIFVVFERPTAVEGITVSFSNPGFPQYEIKQTTNRSVVLNVSGSIPAGFLEVYVKP
jgi:hypothetical protein